MLSLLGSLLGFAGSAVPAITDHYAKKNEQKFELDKMRVAADIHKQGAADALIAFQAKAGDEEHARLIQHDISINQGQGWISALQRSVRPVITYSFFLLFVTIEVVLLRQAIEAGMSVSESILILWDEDTKSIFAAIISFWFGSRAIDKARSK